MDLRVYEEFRHSWPGTGIAVLFFIFSTEIPRRIRRMWTAIIFSVAVTAVAAIFLANILGSERHARHLIEHDRGITDEQIRRELDVVLGRPAITGNRIEHLCNGDEIFPAMLEAIDGAQVSVTFETFIYWSGEIAQCFSRALSARARAGVAVHVLLDWAGSVGMDDELVTSMTEAGVEVEFYHPLSWYHVWRMNNRTHRKILVIDGQLGFIGGVGIADEWLGNAETVDQWRDSHFSVRGPVVAQLQAAFLDNWLKTSGRLLRGKEYFPELPEAGMSCAQVLASSPTGGSESMHLMYLLAISAAKKSIDLAAAYFVPDRLTIKTMLKALERGVRIRIVVPGVYNDSVTARHASRAQWTRLMQAGAEIYEFEPTMYHTKILIVDGFAVSVGSTNFDNRSFRLNNEASLNVYDLAFAEQLTNVIESDIRRCHEIDLTLWRQRSLRHRFLETICYMWSSQL